MSDTQAKNAIARIRRLQYVLCMVVGVAAIYSEVTLHQPTHVVPLVLGWILVMFGILGICSMKKK